MCYACVWYDNSSGDKQRHNDIISVIMVMIAMHVDSMMVGWQCGGGGGGGDPIVALHTNQ